MHKAARLLTVAALTLLAAPQMATAQVMLRNGIGKCLNVEAGAARNGTRLIGYACDMNDRNEMFYMQPDGTIRALSPSSNFCVDAAAPGGDGNQVQIWTCNGTQNQRWRYDGGQLRSFNNKCVDLKNGQLWLPIGGNQPAILWGCNGQNNQRWGQASVQTAQPAPPPAMPKTVQAPLAAGPGNNLNANPSLIGTPGAGFVGNTGAALTSSQPLIGGGGGSLRVLNAQSLTQVTPLAELANVTPLRGFSTQTVADPATRVQRAFQVALGRQPTPAEQSAWVNWIASHPQYPGTRNPEGIVEMLRCAMAHPGLGRELRWAVLERAFVSRFGRSPAGGELAGWDQKVQANRYVYADVVSLMQAAVNSPNARPAPRATAH